MNMSPVPVSTGDMTDLVDSSADNSSHEVDISRGSEVLPEEPPDQSIRIWLLDSMEKLQLSRADLSVRIVTKDEMTELNSQYRGKSSPTNVLSFKDGLIDEEGRTFLGDIVLCNQVVLEESEEYGKSFESRYAHLLVHGLLHLLGHDHDDESDRSEMEKLETELLKSLGFPDPYEVAKDE